MNSAREKSSAWPDDATVILALFLLFCLLVLFANLGGPALFEPDEGRNAEKAREMLLIRDWVTPHENFLPVLDKPVFFYWLIALCYKLFGFSEWSARFPSALAGLGTVILIYLFVRDFLGPWEALWSGLILVTNLEFYALAHIVIFDMTLTFFVTLSLCLFYWGSHAHTSARRKMFLLLMYASMGAGTLVKGPIGLVLPGMVIFSYALLSRKRRFFRDLHLPLGSMIFILIVAPWYVWVEIRNPGYLRYFLWEENFIRFLTPHFNRSEPWYYFLIVVTIGFIPWTVLVPLCVKARWRRPADEKTQFLALWTILPFIFFSLSNSKLPHYVLPIYPPLAILVGEAVASSLKSPSEKKGWPLWLPALNLSLLFAASIVGLYWPNLLPHRAQGPMLEKFHEVPGILIAATLLGATLLALAAWKRVAIRQGSSYILCCAGFVLYFLLAQPIVGMVSLASSSKGLAEKSAAFIHPGDQVVIYDTYASSLPFYLRTERPIWVVWSGKKSSIMGSFYVAEQRPQPAAGYGKALLTFEEFSEQWGASKKRLLVFAKEKNLSRIANRDQSPPNRILQVGDMVLAANR